MGKKLAAGAVLLGSLLGLITALSPAASGQTAPAVPTNCTLSNGYFCAYRDSKYSPLPPLLISAAPAGTNGIGVTPDAVSSGRNGTNNHWCGKDNAVPTYAYDFGPHTGVSYVGNSNNDRFDYFNVRSSACS